MSNTKTTASQKKQALNFNSEAIAKADLLLSALAHPVRLELLHIIQTNKLVARATLQQQLRIHPTVLSKHLAHLCTVGILTVIQMGRSRLYQVNAPGLKRVQWLVRNLL